MFHTVVVTHINNQLSEYVSRIKKAKKKPNMCNLLSMACQREQARKVAEHHMQKRAKSESIEERVEHFPIVPKSPSVSAAVPISITIDSDPTIQQACATSSVSHSLFQRRIHALTQVLLYIHHMDYTLLTHPLLWLCHDKNGPPPPP